MVAMIDGYFCLKDALVRIALGDPAPSVPDHHGTAAIFALGNRPFKSAVGKRMILSAHGKPLVGGIHAGSFGDSPTQ